VTSYYNEHDPYAAQWLRNLIAAGHIAPGIVDERSIEDVFPSDLRGFTQCHFFAGIGVWSHALRRSGWADSRPVWTGSCPCQPFSSAGQGAAFDDERHLWPAFHHLIKECKPAIVLGEQVASKKADPWIDLVQADVEAMGYTFGAIPFPSAGIGAPHIRDRIYWVANADHSRRIRGRAGEARDGRVAPRVEPERLCNVVGLADTRHDDASRKGKAARAGQPQTIGPADQSGGCCAPFGRLAHACGKGHQEQRWQRSEPARLAEADVVGGMADLSSGGRREECADHGRSVVGDCAQGISAGLEHGGSDLRPGPTKSLWRDADWLLCRDGKWRPVEPGTFPLVDGSAKGVGRSGADWRAPAGQEGQGHRAGRLKGYGNAINAEAARVFVACVMEAAA
jgi:DNA (cytosine-5)-methyltransferase 1